MKQIFKKFRLPMIVAAVVLAAAMTVGVVFLVNKHNRIEQRNEMVDELLSRKGEYDEKSIVLFNTNPEAAEALAEKTGAKLRITENGKFATLTLPDDKNIIDVVSDDELLPDVKKMSADWQVSLSEINYDEELTAETAERLPTRPRYSSAITDNYYPSQSYLDYMNMSDIWDRTRGSGVTVAVIDTGIDTDHPEFAGRISEYSYNASEDKIVKDYNDWSLIKDQAWAKGGHGTMVTGVIAAAMNGNGVVGIAPEVNIIVIKADCDEQGNFKRTSDLVFGLYYAVERDVDVVNMSFGGGYDPALSAALQLAVDSDIICVAAAGNDSSADPTYPAADPNCIGVGALAADSWELADYSNFGESVDVVAPGTTLTTKTGGGYGSADGTSLAAPAVTGSVALYLSRNRYTEYKDLQEVLFASCYDLGDPGEDFYYGYGAIDVSALILEERGRVTFDYLTDEMDNTEQIFIRNHTLQNMPIPERLYAIFDGWYYDDQMTEEYNWYEDKFSTDLTLYANWVNEDDGVPYTYVELDDGTIEIRSYTGHRRFIVMPTYIDGKIVSSIGVGALAGQTRIRQVTLPGKLVRIRDSAFANCTNLVNIDIPDTVTEIGERAFSNGVRLSSVSFGNDSQLRTIGDFAFSGCAKLRTFAVQKNVTYLNGSAFFGCTNMTSFSVVSGNTTFKAESGVLFNKSGDTVVAYPAGVGGEYTMPSGVRTVGIYAFAGAKISSVELANVTTLNEAAFYGSRLENIEISDTVTAIGESVFAENYYLKTAKLGRGTDYVAGSMFSDDMLLTQIVIPNNYRTIGGGAFSGTGLQTVTLETGSVLETIGGSAFSGTPLTAIEFPDTLKYIGEGAFSATPLNSVHFPKSLCEIGGGAFYECLSLDSVTFEDGIVLREIAIKTFADTPSLKSISLPPSIETIGEFAFSNSGLTGEIVIPSAVNSIGAGAFEECHSLTDIIVEDGNTVYKDIGGVLYTIDEKVIHTYPAGNSRTEYTISDNTETVFDYAFCGSWNLNSVNTNSVITVSEYGFYDCIGMRSYILGEPLTYIKAYAFSGNSSLGSTSIPDNVIQISNYAFAQDWNLRYVNFTENSKLPRISYGAFAYCGLYNFTVPANVSTMAQYAFKGCSRLTSFTFAENSKLESISAYMFDGCNNLLSITFLPGSKLTSIQAHGLEGMRRLTSIDLGDAKITNIDNFAFRFCESLTSFNVPEGVTYLGRYAFYQCKNLSEVRLPASLEYIGRYAFLQTNSAQLYFAAETLPETLQEDWDYGAAGYYLGVTNVIDGEEWKYAELSSGGIAILQYKGTDKNIDMTALDLGGDIVNIGGKAFRWSEIESIVIPDTVKIIQNEAFYHSNLKSINIPASVTFIGKKAFEYTPIETLTFGTNSQLKTIEYSAFEGTEKLTSVTIPKSVMTLGRAVFKNSAISSLTFENGISLTEIPKEAFAYTKITSLSIPDSVGIVWDNAFRQTEKLETVDFGNNPDLKIRSNAFYQSGLKTLNIPANVTYIGEYSFVALENLQNFTVDENNPYYKSVDGLLISKDGRKLISVPAGRTGSLTVPEGIEVIGFGAFENSKLTTVNFRSDANILSFGYRAFFGMRNMKEITIPASVVSIDYYAFAYCENLEKVTFADGSKLTGVYEGAFCGDIRLSDIELPETIIEISDFAFYDCESITEIPVSEPENLKGIYSYAFAYTGITGELTTPENLIDIGDYAFMGLDVTKITVPDTQQYDLVIGIGAFENCNNLEEMTLPFIGASLDDLKISWFGYVFGAGIYNNAYEAEKYKANNDYIPESLKTVTISEGQTLVGPGAFCWIQNIEILHLPKSITEVYEWSFNNTTFEYGLESGITLKYIDKYGIDRIRNTLDYDSYFGYTGITRIALSLNVTSISDSMFRGCNSLVSVTIPDSVTSIGDLAFCDCSGLTSVTIGESVTSIGSQAFYNCSSLTSIKIPDSVTSIDSYAFRDCSSLTSITIPDGVTSIGYQAFYDCNSLTSVTIGESVTSIGDYAFRGCSSLTSLTIPDSVTSIGDLAFCDCSGLTSVTIGESVTSIGDHAFFGCSGLTSVTIGESVTSIGNYAFYDCNSLINVTIGESVTSIGNYAFYGCSSLKSITIPDGVTSIGWGAFFGCSSLTSITIPDSVTSIGGNAFNGCSGLTSVTIPDSVTSIGDSSFSDCNNLTSLTIGSGVTSIGNNAFYNCRHLYYIINNSEIDLKVQNNDYGYVSYNALIIENKNGTKQYSEYGYEYIETSDGFLFEQKDGVYRLRAYTRDSDTVTLPNDINGNLYSIYGLTGAKNVIIPNGFTEINDGAFSGCGIKSITIPDSVTSISDYAFSGCSSLTSINIPDSVTSIGYMTFSGCNSLTSITIGNSVTSISDSAFSGCSSLTRVTIGNSVTSISDSAFSGCSSLTSINIPDGVTSIGNYTFSDCSSLTNITIPDSVTSIGDYTFYRCTGLTSITIPDSVTRIGEYAFSGCSSLQNIKISKNVQSLGSGAFAGCSELEELVIDEKNPYLKIIDGVIYNGDLTQIITCIDVAESIVIPNSVTSIGYQAFYGCNSLTSVTIPDSVTSIGWSAFSGCSSLTSVMIPDSVTSISNNAFFGCNSLTSVTIGNGVTSIGDHAFRDCSGLTSVTIPDSVTSIGQYAFYKCSSLTSITIPDSVTSIGGGTFGGCSSLTSVTIGESVTSIGDSAFSSCSGLTSVTIGESVTSIGWSAFSGCSSLTSVMIPDSVTSISNNAFFGCSSLTSVTIGNGVTSIGDHAFRDCSGLTSVTIPDSVTSIGDRAFSGCSSLTSITIPDGITSIGSGAFSNCSSLTSINIPDGVTSIGDRAFSGCSSLTSITIPDSVTSISDSAFSGCSSLTSVTIPDSVTSIGDWAFSSCSSLNSITIGNGVTSIGRNVFSHCNNLTSLTIPDSITSIGDNAFSYCSGLINVTMPNGVTGIGAYAFHYCSSLTSITIPDSVTSIGDQAFYGCSKLLFIINNSDLELTYDSSGSVSIAPDVIKIVNKDGTVKWKNDNGLEYIETADGFVFELGGDTYKLFAYFGDSDIVTLPTDINGHQYSIYSLIGVKNVVISDGFTSIDAYAFSGCSSLNSITIPDSVTSIGERAFSGCSRLKSVTIPDSVTSIGNQAFSYCSSLTSITIPGSVTSLGDEVFYGCSNLNNITIENGVRSIGNEMFHDCISLTSITIPESVTRIGTYAFENCRSLTSITIPDGVTIINDCAFFGCSSLTSITIGNSVTNIGKYAFKNTGVYNDPDSWVNGYLYIDNWLVGIDKSIKYIDIINNAKGVITSTFDGNTIIKFTYGDCIGTTNVESTVIWKREIDYAKWILTSGRDLPITFKNCIIAKNSTIVSSSAFNGITGITIWVEADEKDCRWDENFPGWNNGNRVVYGEDWAYSDFYDVDGKLIFREPRLNSKIILHPYYKLESDAQYDYETGWDLNGDDVKDAIPATSTNNVSARAIITDRQLKSYTVQFVDYDGTVISSDIYDYGETPTIPAAPTRPGDETYYFTFTGWSSEPSKVTGDTKYTAQYEKKYVEYTIKFFNYDGSEFLSKTYHYGDIVKAPSEPTRASDDTYTYTFSGWDKELENVTESTTYTATYTAEYIDYTIKFADYDGTVLSEKTYHYGETVNVPNDPERVADSTYTYAFDGWNKAVTTVIGNETYTATYKSAYIDYTVRFVDYDETVLSEKTYHYSDTVTAPSDPQRAADNTYTYSFNGWDKQITEVNGNAEYTAVYTAVYIDYTVKFVDYDDTVLSERTYHYGDTVTAPDNPTREKDGEYTYTFSGWDKDITQCTGSETYRATYTTDENVYTVTFKNYDGTVISVRTYNYNNTVTEPAQPLRVSDDTYYYVFTGWDKEVATVTANAEYTAVFEARAHEWDEPTYEWSTDHTSVTAKRVSKNDNTITQTEKVIANVNTTEADCENNGKTVYTAIFVNTVFSKQTYEETIPASGHSFRFTDFTWNGNEAYANYKCDNCNKTTSVKASVTERTTEPTCENEGETVYTANVKASDSPDGKSHTDEKKVSIEAKGHTWTFAGFTWIETENGYTAEAGYSCSACEKTEKISAKITVTTTAASCEEAGEIVYTAIIEAEDSCDNTKHTDTKTISVAQVGHTWSFTGFTWTGNEAYANYKCGKCEKTDTVKADVTRTEKDATCTEDGVITYTAKVTAKNSLDNSEHVDTKTVKGEDAKGHVYGEPEWIWDNEAHTAKAKFVCTVCSDTKEIEAEVTNTEKDGVITYTAKVTLDGITYSDETIEYIDYTVVFKDYDGTVLSEKTYHYGDEVTIPDDPEREEDDTYTYSFSGWDKEITEVKGNETYTARYEATEKQQTQFVPGDINGDGSVNNKDVVALFKYVSGGEIAVNDIALDINGDGSVNNKDVVALFKYVSGGDIELSDKPYNPNAKVMILAIIPERIKVY